MPDPISSFLTPEVTLILVFGTLFAEALAWFFMPRWYFSQGIPLFTARSTLHNVQPGVDLGALLEEHQPASAFARFKFKQFDETLIGFRESSGFSGFWKWNYTPVMRAALTVDRIERSVTLCGYANYSVLLLVPAATLHTLSQPMSALEAVGLMAFIALIMGGIYIAQMLRYQNVLVVRSFARRA